MTTLALTHSRRALRAAAFAVFVGSCPVPAADVYRWVDDQGRVSYSDHPQTQSAVRLDIIPGPAPSADTLEQNQRTQRVLDAYATERKERAEAREARARAAAESKKKCAAARDEQYRREHAANLFYRDDQGNKRIIEGAEYDAAIEAARRAVDESCG